MRAPKPLLALLFALVVTGAAQAAGSRQPPVPPGPCGPAIAASERKWRLPGGLLPAIARVESGRPDPQGRSFQAWPWTINAEGTGRFFESKEEAVAAVTALQARGVRSIDVGCLQVNLMHHPLAFASLDDAFDPETNAIYAGAFLAALNRQFGTWPLATAVYHSQTPELAADYQRRVMTAWGRPELATLGQPAPPAVTQSAALRAFLPEQDAIRAFLPQRPAARSTLRSERIATNLLPTPVATRVSATRKLASLSLLSVKPEGRAGAR